MYNKGQEILEATLEFFPPYHSVGARAHHLTSLNALFDILRMLDYYVERPQGSKSINHFVFPFQFLKMYFLTLHLRSSEIASTADRKILLLPSIK